MVALPGTPALVVPWPVPLLGWQERELGCCGGKPRQGELPEGCEGVQCRSASGSPTLCPSKPWHIVRVGSWCAGGCWEQAVGFLEASLEMLAPNQPCSPPRVPPGTGLGSLAECGAPRWPPIGTAQQGSAARAWCHLRPLQGTPAPLSPVTAGAVSAFPGEQRSRLRSREVRGGCRDLRGRITIAGSIVELGAASPPLRRFSPLNAEQMARVLQSEMSLSCLKSN